jgi:nucleoid-associated protein YgaU
MNPRRKQVTLMPAVAMAALAALVAIPALSSSRLYAASPGHLQTVTVQRGDSLWAIAEHLTADGASVQDTVDTIVAVNHLNGAGLVPGQHLRIPR